MQTTKSRNGSSDMPQRTSPATPRTARLIKLGGPDVNPLSSPNPNRNLKNSSPKTLERSSPKSPLSKKRRISKVSELESRLALLQEELKKAKELLSSCEAQKKQAHREAEETKIQLSFLSAKLEDSQQQLVQLSDSEEARLQELRKISQERDRVWQSELESLQKQHALDIASLASAMNEIQRLKNKQLEIVAESEATQSRHAESAHGEIQNLRIELFETLELVEKMKSQLVSKESENRALESASEAQGQLEATKADAEAIRSDGLMAMEDYNSLASELEQSKAQAFTLENLVSQLLADLAISNAKTSADEEIDSLEIEIGQLKSALEASVIRYQEEYIQSTLQIRSAYEAVESAKSESSLKESELKEELKKAKDAIELLKFDLRSKRNTLQCMSHENEELSIKILANQRSIKESEVRVELKKLEVDLTHLKSAFLLDKEIQIQNLEEENDTLRTEISGREVNEEAVALAQAAKAAEKEALMKLGSATEETDKSNRSNKGC